MIVKSAFTTPIIPITVTILPNTNEDRIFTLIAYTDVNLVGVETSTIVIPADHSVMFTRIGVITMSSIIGGPSRAIVYIGSQNPTTGTPITYTSSIDSSSEISVIGGSAIRYFSRYGGTFILKTELGLTGMTAINNTINVFVYPDIPGADGNPDSPSLIPGMTANTYLWKVIPFVMSASSEFSPVLAAYNVTNGNDWCTAGTNAGWIQIKLPWQIYVNKVAIRNVRASADVEYYTKWSITGSNDGVNFTTLLTNDQRVPNVGTSYNLTSPGTYQWFRCNGLEGVGTNTGLSMFQLHSGNKTPVKLFEQLPSLTNNGNNYGNTSVYLMPENTFMYFLVGTDIVIWNWPLRIC